MTGEGAKDKKIPRRFLHVPPKKIDKNVQKQSVEAGHLFIISHGTLTPKEQS
ncbi:MAG: hypothetical protein ACE5FD_19630 [Anaerolineae bacterium]